MALTAEEWGREKSLLEARIAELAEEARGLQVLHRIGVAIAANLDLERLVQTVTDAGVEISKAEFGAFFYNVTDDKGEAYTLYTLSGAPREAFANFPMPRNTAIFEPTFRGTGVLRSGDILADPRYGHNAPFNGMPQGHLPVRSYLAVPVLSRSAEVLGGLFFGHSKTDQFTPLAERLMLSIAAQAAVAIDNARLYQTSQRELAARGKAEAELQRVNTLLEARATMGARQLAVSATRLEEAEQHLTLLIDAVVDYAIFMLDPFGNVVSWNSGAQRIKGYDRDEIVGQHFSRFYTEADRTAGIPAHALAHAMDAGKYEMEGWRLRKDGSRFWANVVITAIRDDAGTLIGFAKITRDLTERRATEERLRQAQKMEAVGQLTGGLAHDFNNLLTVITGNIETLKRRLADRSEPALERLASAAQRGAERGALLVHRLLAFSRSQPLAPKAVSVNTLVGGMSDMLRRTLGETILIENVLAGGLWTTFVDTTELESALLNLAINARDAMPDGGRLTIEAANVFLDEAYAAEAEIAPGQYVGIFVSDTGTGMTPDVIAKAFEPFFTTKGVGEGTGLGLSQVYGFIKQSGGHVKVYSEVGAGTTVKLYLPRHIEPATRDANPAAQAAPQGHGETILVVEDDPDVRTFTIEMLRELSYTVVEATDGQGALRMLDAHREIVLLFTDVGLPGGMNGRQLADEALRRRNQLKVLFTSGYARNAIVHHGRLDPGVELLSKPFTFAMLGARIRRLLDGK
ncbi:MAG TPA: PAS domain S-box protein [Stellaceae bacterium]|jgi:PAS domain S-box-containing protein